MRQRRPSPPDTEPWELRVKLKKLEDESRIDAADLARLRAIRAEASIADEPACVTMWDKIIKTEESDIQGKIWARVVSMNEHNRSIAELS
jgi:hypothetical protein